jgi:hypothetical protein
MRKNLSILLVVLVLVVVTHGLALAALRTVLVEQATNVGCG